MAAAIDSSLNRRAFLRGAAGVSIAALPLPAFAGDELIGKLIAQSRGLPTLVKRIDAISAALVGKRYHADTLIGGPRRPEVFVVRDDAFDCVTYCETVLAAAHAHDIPSFEAALRDIRYHNGEVAWRERNHDFAAWCERNVENGLCKPLSVGRTVDLRKAIGTPPELGRRVYSIAAIPRTVFMAHRDKLEDGDVIGFVSIRPSLDYYHTGFIMHGRKDELILRHASQSHGRVVDERMDHFLAANRVHYVTLLRPQDKTA
jgi:hypothetical protein